MFQSFDDIVSKMLPDETFFSVKVEMFTGLPSDWSFKDIFDFEDQELNSYGKVISDWMDISHETNKYLSKLHWLIRSLLQFQDLLSLVDLKIPKETDSLKDLLCRHHCYYEALVYLRSGILSLINANSISAITILRPIFEQFIYSILWDIIQDEGNTDKYNHWIKSNKGKPSFRDAIDKISEILLNKRKKLTKTISRNISNIIKSYSILCTWSHTPTVDDSFVVGGSGLSKGLSEWLFCIHMYNLILNNLLYLYIIQYPMILFPVDVIRKWGCKMPVGVFVDECTGAIIKRTLGEAEFTKLSSRLINDQEVHDKLDFANKYTGLTDDEIWKTWDESSDQYKGLSKPDNLMILAAQQKGQIRSMGWGFNYLPKKNIEGELTKEEIDFFDNFYGGLF